VAIEKAIMTDDWKSAATLANEFELAMYHHFSVEEEYLFPAILSASAQASGPIRVMTMEHEQMRHLISNLSKAVSQQSRADALGMTDTLLVTMQQHNMKEEHVLYPMADSSVPVLSEEISRRVVETA
jgi:hemerythrin-like domain-containing protein